MRRLYDVRYWQHLKLMEGIMKEQCANRVPVQSKKTGPIKSMVSDPEDLAKSLSSQRILSTSAWW